MVAEDARFGLGRALPSRGFNGAATRWSRRAEFLDTAPTSGESMLRRERRLDGRGEAWVKWFDAGQGRCFNGAATRWSRREGRLGARKGTGYHGFNGAATRWSRRAAATNAAMQGNVASTEPRLDGRGETGTAKVAGLRARRRFNGAATRWSRRARRPGRSDT